MTKVAGAYGQRRVPNNATGTDTSGLGLSPAVGVYIGTVKRNDDPQHMGRLKVYIEAFGSSDPEREEGWVSVSYASPLAGSTSIFEQGNNVTEYSDTMKPYGMWVPQPDIDTQVLVAFAGGRLDLGFWFACLYNRGTQVTVPGIPAKKTYDGENISAAPKNKKDKDTDLEKLVTHKPLHDALVKQGLDKDPIRGITSSSATRETPSKVFGVLTPGQHQFVLDDGDKDGNNKLIRLRTTNGAQLLIDDVTGHIYAITKDGQSWLELSNDGQIHLFGTDNINIRTGGNLNIHADKSINIEAGDKINVSSVNDTTVQSGAHLMTIARNDTMITSGANSHINSISGHYETAGRIHMNGPAAYQSKPLSPNNLPVNTGITESICTVVPELEPWKGHAGKLNPVGPGNQQMKQDPAPDQTPRQPDPDEQGSPINKVLSDDAQGEDVPVTEASTSQGALDMIKEGNQFSSVNIDDGDGQSIGYGSELATDIMNTTSLSDNPITAIDIGGNGILESQLSSLGGQLPESGSMDAFKNELTDKLNLDNAIQGFSMSNLGGVNNGFIPGEVESLVTNGISPQKAEQMLLNDLSKSENSIKSMLSANGVSSIKQNQFDALVSYHNQLGDASYAFVNNEKIDLTGLYKKGEWDRAASFIAADERNRTRRITEANLMVNNQYPQVSQSSVINSGYTKINELLGKGKLNLQTGSAPTAQQQIAAASSYFNQFGKAPAGLSTPVKLAIGSDPFSLLTKKSIGPWSY